MATILLTWELGAGTGHCVNLLPVAQHLSKQGHEVYLALRDLSLAHAVFGDLNVKILQAPYKPNKPDKPIPEAINYAHILHNIGFEKKEELSTLAQAWRNLYDCVKPDLIVFEHSPTALLASQGFNSKKVLLGTGFFTPPDTYPLPILRPWMNVDLKHLQQDEDRVLDNANHLLKGWRRPPLDRLGQLFAQVDENILLTFSELDHYQQRQEAKYWGHWSITGGGEPDWPAGEGPKVFGYLRPFKTLPYFLKLIRQLQIRAYFYVVGFSADMRRQFEGGNLKLADRRVDMVHIGRECDLAILNGNAGTTTSLLLAGKPSFQLPVHLEQTIFSKRIVDAQVGSGCFVGKPQQFKPRLTSMLQQNCFASAAQNFADRYQRFTQEEVLKNVITRFDELLAM